MTFRYWLGAATALLLVVTACTDGPTTFQEAGRPDLARKKPPKPPPEDPILYNATFRDHGEDGVLSDGGGSYSAVIMANGNFKLDTRGSGRSLIMVDPEMEDDGYITTSHPQTSEGVPLSGGLPEMGEGTDMRSWAQVYMSWNGLGMSKDSEREKGRSAIQVHRESIGSSRSFSWSCRRTSPGGRRRIC